MAISTRLDPLLHHRPPRHFLRPPYLSSCMGSGRFRKMRRPRYLLVLLARKYEFRFSMKVEIANRGIKITYEALMVESSETMINYGFSSLKQ